MTSKDGPSGLGKITRFFSKSPPLNSADNTSNGQQERGQTRTNTDDPTSKQPAEVTTTNTEITESASHDNNNTPGVDSKKRGFPYSPGEACTPHTSNLHETKKFREKSPIPLDLHTVCKCQTLVQMSTTSPWRMTIPTVQIPLKTTSLHVQRTSEKLPNYRTL